MKLNSIAISPDGKILATGSDSGEVIKILKYTLVNTDFHFNSIYIGQIFRAFFWGFESSLDK